MPLKHTKHSSTHIPYRDADKGFRAAMTEREINISVRHFLRIPGLGDEHGSADLLVDGSTLSVAELVGRLAVQETSLRTRAIEIVKQVSSPNRSEIHTISNALFSLASDNSCPEARLSNTALDEFLITNAFHPEAISIGSQLLRIRSKVEASAHSTSNEALVSALRNSLTLFPSISATSTKQDILEARYVLLRAFEAPQLIEIASSHISTFLRGLDPCMTNERKAFAGQFLSAVRTLSYRSESIVELTRVATCVFATGILTTPRRSTPPPPPTFDSRSKAAGSEAVAPGLTPHAADLVKKLVADDRQELVPRLLPQDFQVLRQVAGLQLEVFRLVTERIRRRAASDPWARAAILDLVRAPHDPEVTGRVRTAVLGALVNDARRIGKLSTQLEKEVFAISAEIPDLPFLNHEHTAIDETEQNSPTPSLS